MINGADAGPGTLRAATAGSAKSRPLTFLQFLSENPL